MFVNKLFTYRVRVSQKVKGVCFNVKSSRYYFDKKTKILADFQICISEHLILLARDFNSV